MKKGRILEATQYYEGFNQFSVYNIEAPSLNPQKNYIHLNKREILHCSDSVIVLIYASEIDSFVFCQQFRSGIFFNPSEDDPFPLECVAGSIEKNHSPEETAYQEVREEAGLEVGHLREIMVAYTSPGIITEKTHIFYVTVKEVPQSQLGGLESEGEEILTHVIKREDVYQMMDNMKINDVKTLLALNWFRREFS
ncbi:NUDIX domain-containing protein [Legionella israelensis]|uniref:ADP-ribose pyrophosphatase n=1 Tax=Legionella israelensis TaxID=454 RepID=A0A0W0VMU5_9GAMM|nr:NUDIX domain-containing protein [Legionella israelensis]KTD21441.1 ADP-ribose pyrophosphatase [Legionella israelensis]QBS08440.1 NUDIX domain-containing protein [Legionella israelensis]SCY15567.1 ADP-ribose pyrophosphatase [Legionella israelensis DSM 19235]STX58076.1 ADP-ribose pyrophosphatase [Legionella israelensis]